MIQGIDYAWGRPDPGAVKRAGYAFVLRYLATGGPITMGKVIGLAERQALHAAGLGVGLVWETYANRPLEGAPAGTADGQAARSLARDLGFPDGFPIFGSVDFDPPPTQYPTIAAYLQAGNFECYANAGTCQYMADHGICRHFWQHDWGGGTFGGRHLHQRGQIELAGAQVDVNDAYETCCIWFPGQSQPVPQPHPLPESLPEEDTMLCFTDGNGHFRCDPDGAVYAFDLHGNPGGKRSTGVDLYLGGLNIHPSWQAGQGKSNGAPFVFGPTPEGGYVITTRDAQGEFHSYVFPPDGSLAKT